MKSVYLDHNATTPLDPRVREAMLPWLGERHGNPSSVHACGQAAREAVETARGQVAGLLGASPPEIVFAASGTEANNAVIFSCARACAFTGEVVITELEHPSVRAAAEVVEEAGMSVRRVAPRADGRVAVEDLAAALTPDTRLVCLMLANNEVGTVQPVAEAGALCRVRGVPLLTDAVQAVGKMELAAAVEGADFVVLGAHKFYGPLGAAVLRVKKGASFTGLLVGGSQERRRRAGTENVAAVVGMGVAAKLAAAELEERRRHMADLRDRFEAGLKAMDAVVHCSEAERLPNTSHVAFRGVDAEALMIRLDLAGFMVSTGSACSSGKVEPSRALLAMGIDRDEALSSLRVSFGTTNTREDVDRFLATLGTHLSELRRLAPAVA